jgi:hypothetical protein
MAGDFKQVSLFVAVDISPTLMGEAFAMYHEPDILRSGLEDRPISHRVDKWVSSVFREGSNYIKAQGFEVNDRLSKVLRVLGIDSEECLKKESEEFFTEKALEFGLPERRGLLGESFEGFLRRAQTWMILSKVRSTYRYESNKFFADAIEAMLTALGEESTPIIKKYLEELKYGSRKEICRLESILRSKDSIANRLATHSLNGRLGPSQNHIQSRAEPKWWKPVIEGKKPPGAGDYMFLWLLPLALFDAGVSDQVDRLARLIKSALERVPDLFKDLNDLVRQRNAIHHPERKDGINGYLRSPELLNDEIMKVWGALEQAADHIRAPNLAAGKNAGEFDQCVRPAGPEATGSLRIAVRKPLASTSLKKA